MRRAALAAWAAALFVLGGASAATADELDLTNVYHGGVPRDGMLVADRIIVHFAEGSTPQPTLGKDGRIVTGRADVDALDAAYGVHGFDKLFGETPATARARGLKGQDVLARIYAVDFDASHPLAEVVARYRALPGVTRVEPVGIHSLDAVVPNDPQLNAQAWLRATTPGARDIRAIAGWFYSAGDSSVVLAVGDSGVDWQHPDLGGSGPNYARGNIWINWDEYNGVPGFDDDHNGKIDDIRGWDFITGVTGEQNPPQDVSGADNDPMDYEGHGTSVAGCIAAIGDNGVGVVGGAWHCKVMPMRIGWLPPGAGIGVVRMDFAAQAIDYAVVNGARVFNASWGSSDSGGLGAAVTNAVLNNVVVVTAAGNDNADLPSYLGNRSDVIAAAAVTTSDTRASFSSYGAWVEVCAPGTGILTTAYNRFASGGSQHTYGTPSGTSFASPITCSVVGIIFSRFPGFTGAQARARLIASVDEVDSRNPGFDGLLGSGRVSMAKISSDHFFQVPDQCPTMLDALNTADLHDTVAVRGGVVLDESVQLQGKPMQVLGGWNAGYTSRDPVNNKAVLSPTAGDGAVLRAASPVDSNVVVDGFELRGGVASDQPFEPVTGKYGGGVLVKGASPKLRNLYVHDNIGGTNAALGSGGGGGGGIAVLGGMPIFQDVEVTANSALLGAGMYVHHGSPVFRRINLHANTSYAGDGFSVVPDGGGVYVINTSSPKLPELVSFYGGRIAGHAVSGRGGAIFASNSNVLLRGVTVEDNTATGNGAGLYVSTGSLDAKDDTLQSNTRQGTGSTVGGGLFANGAAVTLDGDLVKQNASGLGGAGIYLDSCINASLTRVALAGNNAGLFGGALYANACTGLTVSNCTVVSNTGALAGANGVYLSGGSAIVTHSILAFNGGGGSTLADGVQCQSASASFACNLVFSNTAGNYGGCPDPTGSNGNAAGDPAFCNLAGGDYRVASTSPAAPAQSGGCGLIGARNADCGSVAVEDHPSGQPAQLVVGQNVPNPFNPRTTIRFSLPEAGPVRVAVYDLRGRLLRVLVAATLPAGSHDVTWDGRDDQGRVVASGAYFYAVDGGAQRIVRKMGLLR